MDLVSQSLYSFSLAAVTNYKNSSLKTAQVYYLTILWVRSPKVKVSPELCSFLEAHREIPCPRLLALKAAGIP